MRAMILAAGMGKRMQPLTADLPKPLLTVGDKTLIEHQIERLIAGGVTGVVINHFYLGSMIEEALGDGSQFGIDISYSREAIRLETAGGIIKSLPQLKDDSFIVVNADIWTDFDFSTLQAVDGVDRLAHLVLVENADHNPHGDFSIDDDGRVHEDHSARDKRLTFSGISVMHKNLFAGLPIQPCSTVPLLQQAMAQNRVSGEIHAGEWKDIGTPERLQEINEIYTGSLNNGS
ncbi:MAG: nucleotidyltransferase family protein [Gammaproteobacteria bacterium]|jgi:MurNAc alpha-1-phosphate uridylyltransferase|nr:nucleotidyltransferase family protein [Gammaproteobacteria bacterium]MBT3858641.1 nucleotidyltransferase family protein [Gammaproteobacteria bacterium]MBT3987776.1 nucleotidyltransferase family protein [Gammaproteobacteria bacterium]MBT4255850.1 nucleotidyltransferase family protein [Gammaproteobacteria bacterium]MBT4583258.1 nucleotidyltransferase family protein [Gammaproteobacteria bacterium]